jgi:lysophospholipase L1-like esterase
MLKKVGKQIFKDLRILLLLLVCAEITLQFYAPEYSKRYFDRDFTGGHLIDLNKHGYRGALMAREKAKKNTFRILAIGDSVTFGTGVAVNDTWASTISRSLAKKFGDDISVEVVNAGQPGISIKQMEAFYINRFANGSFDLVILGFTASQISLSRIKKDVTIESMLTPRVPIDPSWSENLRVKIKRKVHNFVLPSFASINIQRFLYLTGVLQHNINPAKPYGPMLAYGFMQRNVPKTAISKAWELFTNDLSHFKKTITENKSQFAIVYIPPRFELSSKSFDNEKAIPTHRMQIDPFKKLDEICKNENIQLINATNDMLLKRQEIVKERGEAAPLYLMFDYLHIDSDGHQAVAGSIVDNLKISKP